MLSKNTESQKSSQYKFFIFLAVMYVVILLLTMFVENRIVIIDHVKILSGTLIIPLSYALSDVITEIYGYREMRKLIWISIAALYISAAMIFCITHLPSDPANKINNAYGVVLNYFPRDVVTYSIAACAGIFLNSYLLSKWKIMISGKMFWLRSLGSTMIGEVVFILTWGFLGFSNQFQMADLFGLMIASLFCKIAYNLLAIIPTSLLVRFLSGAEGGIADDSGISFNPLALKV